MKKFVGYVNGKSFDNEKDFNIAADEAIKSNDGNLAISSYYSYTNEEEKQLNDGDEPNWVLPENIVLKDGESFSVSDELKKKLQNASNKTDIKKKAEDIVTYLDCVCDDYKDTHTNLDKELLKVKNAIDENNKEWRSAEYKRKYYQEIVNIVDDSQPVKEEEKKYTKQDIRKILEKMDSTQSFKSILKALNLLN